MERTARTPVRTASATKATRIRASCERVRRREDKRDQQDRAELADRAGRSR